MEPIFNEKIVKKWYLWVRKQCTMHYSRLKSQHLWLLFMNSSHKPPEMRAQKKKKGVKRGRERGSNPFLDSALN